MRRALKTPAFDSNGPLCVFVLQKEHVTLAFLRGARLPDPPSGKMVGMDKRRKKESAKG